MITLLDKAYLIRLYIKGILNCDLGDEEQRSIGRLQDADLARVNASKQLEVTERGRVFCEALRSLPLPEQKWVMPPLSENEI